MYLGSRTRKRGERWKRCTRGISRVVVGMGANPSRANQASRHRACQRLAPACREVRQRGCVVGCGAGVADGPLHDQPAGGSWQRHRAGGVPGPRRDHRHLLAGPGAVERRLDGVAIIGHAVAQPAEVIGQHRLGSRRYLAKLVLLTAVLRTSSSSMRAGMVFTDQRAVAAATAAAAMKGMATGISQPSR